MQPEALDELQRILESPYFRTSKRCSSMLRYIVEHAVENPLLNVKERTIGVEVFHRPPDYDTTADPVVRTTAGEIRKRLAQYFSDHPDARVLMTLPAGSYLPVIRERCGEEKAVEFVPVPVDTPLPTELTPTVVEPRPSAIPEPSVKKSRSFPFRLVAVASLLFVAAGVLFVWKLHRPSPLETFWEPITSTGKHPSLCLGDLTTLIKLPGGEQQAYTTLQSGLVKTATGSRDQLALADVAALNNVAGYLAVHGTTGNVFNSGSVTFAQLRDQPLILIGGRSNPWSMRKMANLPFQIVNGPIDHVVGIRDVKQGAGMRWSIDFNAPYEKITHEYALVARFQDPETNQPTILIAGVGANGTVAGSVFATQAQYMEQLTNAVGRDWQKHNLEVVLETQIVNGDYAPPRILASATW